MAETFLVANNKGADLTAHMCRLVCPFVVRKHHIEVHFKFIVNNLGIIFERFLFEMNFLFNRPSLCPLKIHNETEF